MTTRVADAAARRMRVTLVLCFLAALADGYDIQSMGVAAPHMAPALGLARDQLGLVFSASIAGLLVGAVLIGRAADRAGRKWTLIASLAVYAVFSAATAGARGLDSLLIIRFIAGLGLGGAMPNLIALAAEAVPPGRRSLAVTIVASGFPFGSALAAAIAAGFDWPVVFYAGGMAPLALALTMTVALPESAAFLRARTAPPTAVPERTDFATVLFGGGRALTTPLLWLGSFCALVTLYLLLNWLPTLMGLKGVSKVDASLVSLLFNLGGGLGVLLLASLLDRARPMWILTSWYAALAVSLIALAAAAGPVLAVTAPAGFFAGMFVSSAPIAFYGLAPGYYPVAMRGAGVGATIAVGRVGAIAGPLAAAALLAAGAGASGVLIALLPTTLVAGAASLALLRRPTVET